MKLFRGLKKLIWALRRVPGNSTVYILANIIIRFGAFANLFTLAIVFLRGPITTVIELNFVFAKIQLSLNYISCRRLDPRQEGQAKSQIFPGKYIMGHLVSNIIQCPRVQSFVFQPSLFAGLHQVQTVQIRGTWKLCFLEGFDLGRQLVMVSKIKDLNCSPHGSHIELVP